MPPGVCNGALQRMGLRSAGLACASALILTGCSAGPDHIPTSMPSAVDHSSGAGQNLAAVAPMALESLSTSTVPVYWLGINGKDIQLYREFRATGSTAEPISTAIRAMTSERPDDPDYFSPWRPAQSVSATVSSNNTITVDMPAEAFAVPLDEGVAQRAVQQLVYTATAAAAKAGVLTRGHVGNVVVLVDGRAGYEAFGYVELGGPMRRNAEFLAPVWIIDPQEDQIRSGRSTTVTGSGVSPDSILQWELSPVELKKPGPPDSRPRLSGQTVIDSVAGTAGEFSIQLDLPPGKYRVSVSNRTDPGGGVNADTREFTVRNAEGSAKNQ